MSSLTTIQGGAKVETGRSGLLASLDAMPHPSLVVEVAPTHVAAARWGRGIASLAGFSAEPLPEGAIAPSATQTNIADGHAVRTAIHSAMSRVPHQGADATLLLPDTSVRVFILPFDTFSRSASEALPLLRWRLKKSLPFDAEEAVISWMRQASREGKVEIVAAVARQKIVREYESVLEQEGLSAGVVQSSTLATLSLLNGRGATLLVRQSGRNLTTVIVRGETMCVYRSTEMGADSDLSKTQTIFDEVFPAIAFYQDGWGQKVDQVRVAGFGEGEEELREELSREIGCASEPLASSAGLSSEARSLVTQGFEPLVGWQLNRGA